MPSPRPQDDQPHEQGSRTGGQKRFTRGISRGFDDVYQPTQRPAGEFHYRPVVAGEAPKLGTGRMSSGVFSVAAIAPDSPRKWSRVQERASPMQSYAVSASSPPFLACGPD